MSQTRSTSPAAKAARHAVRAHETAVATAEVIAARVEMGRVAMTNPSFESASEASTMVAEKMLAFSEAGAAVAGKSGEMAASQMRYAMDETARSGAAMAQLAACKTPADLALAQGQLAMSFFSRGMAHGLSLGALAVRASEVGLKPIHRTVTANAKRLKTS
ncbi:MAG: phasin family protein [Caulobacteraceae bacterium]